MQAKQEPALLENQEAILNENINAVSEPIALTATSSPNQPLSNEMVNSVRNIAQSVTSSHAEKAVPAGQSVFLASVLQQQSPPPSAPEHSSPSPAQMAEYLRFANQGGK